MSIIDNITDLMLRQGDINAQMQREKIAAEEEQRRNKHRNWKMTLKALATFGPMFLPGGPLAGLLGSGIGMSTMNNRGMGSDDDRYQEYRY